MPRCSRVRGWSSCSTTSQLRRQSAAEASEPTLVDSLRSARQLGPATVPASRHRLPAHSPVALWGDGSSETTCCCLPRGAVPRGRRTPFRCSTCGTATRWWSSRPGEGGPRIRTGTATWSPYRELLFGCGRKHGGPGTHRQHQGERGLVAADRRDVWGIPQLSVPHRPDHPRGPA
jgi:hypothetical protein